MKKTFVLLLLLFGCEPVNNPNIQLKSENNIVLKSNHMLTVTDLGEQYNKVNSNTYWQLVELDYEGTKYVYLRSYQNGPHMVLLTQIPITKVKAEIETGL